MTRRRKPIVRVHHRPSGWVLATADQAHQHLNRTKRERDEAAREGLTTELITMRHYREHIGASWKCDAHAPATSRDTE